jgi:hypothetical protein
LRQCGKCTRQVTGQKDEGHADRGESGGNLPGHAAEVESIGTAIQSDHLLCRQVGQQQRACDKDRAESSAGQEVTLLRAHFTAGLAPGNKSNQRHEENAADER